MAQSSHLSSNTVSPFVFKRCSLNATPAQVQDDGSNIQYTHSDGTTAKTKLNSLRARMARIERAIAEATESDPLPGADELLIDKVKTFANTMSEELAEAEVIEEERRKKEEAARLKAERRKKKKKK